MLIQVYLLLLSVVGIYALHAYDQESKTEDELFGQLEFIFPSNFLSKFPNEGEFFRLKIIMYLFFNIFAKYFGEKDVAKFWSKFNQNDFNRVAIDAAFYEYLTKFADRKRKHLIFNPLESPTSSPEGVAVDRIGHYIDNLAADQISFDQSETDESQATETKDDEAKSAKISSQIPTVGIPGKDFPNYCDIPKTSFTCANKIIPGIYADLETGCQVFHVCSPSRIDSFLCPIGTTFNQALLTCDFWPESDCPSSPIHFDRSGFTVTTTEETLTTLESSSAFTPEPDCRDYDETCQNLLSKPLQLRMKFLPAKCQVTQLKPKASNKDKHLSRLIADSLSRGFRDMFEFITKATDLGRNEIARKQVAVQPKLERKHTSKSHSKILKAVTKSISTYGKMDTTGEGQMHPSTTELLSDLPSQVNFRIAEKTVFKENSHETEKHIHLVRESTLIKPSEESKNHAFDIVMETLELGSHILNDSILPFMETIILESHRKIPKSKKI